VVALPAPWPLALDWDALALMVPTPTLTPTLPELLVSLLAVRLGFL
jgi:hypothetical protein